MSYGPGFSILAWVKSDCVLTSGLSFDTKDELERELLNDAATLWGVRWNIDISLVTINHTVYVFGSTIRFTAGNNTIRNALGELSEHIEFIRGTPANTADELERYKRCKMKWKVQETSDTHSGWEAQAQAETSRSDKRKRF